MRPILSIWLLSLLVLPRLALADPALTEAQVKALFLLNFTRYVEWPEEAFPSQDSPFIICIAGEDECGADLIRLVQDRTVNGRRVAVRHADSATEAANCHVLFIPSSQHARIENLLRETRGHAVLTVGEEPLFLDRGGMVRFLTRKENVRLEINLGAARAADLQISSHLLKVADLVLGK